MLARYISDLIGIALQEGTGHAVGQAWVEITFDNEDGRLGVCPALPPCCILVNTMQDMAERYYAVSDAVLSADK